MKIGTSSAGGTGGGGGKGEGTHADKGRKKFNIALSIWAVLNIAGVLGLMFLSSKLPLSTRVIAGNIVPFAFFALSAIGLYLVLRVGRKL